MANVQSQASLFRQSNYRYSGYLGTVSQEVVASRSVNMASITYPVTQITFDNAYSGSGNTSDAAEGMTIRVYDGNSTRLKGILRVAADAVQANVINVNEFSRGYLDLADNDKFDVIDEYRVWDKLVSSDGNFNKDSRITYTDQTDLYAPVANGGGAWFGHVDVGETFATVQFDAGDSFAVDPDSGGTLTYSWLVDDGTITVGSSTDESITATFPVGCRHVTLTVTDSSNSKSTVQRIPVRVYDRASNQALKVIADTLTLEQDTGASMEFRLPAGDEADIDNLPDGAPLYYWEDENYNGTKASYGSNAPVGRDHMKFVGFLDSDSLTYDAFTDQVVFRAISPLTVLEQTGALPQLLINTASPDEWLEASDLTVKIFIWYLITYGASSFFDFIYDDTRSFDQARIAVTNTQSVAGQLREIADAIRCKLTCDRLGRFIFSRDPNYESVSERNSRTTAYNFTTADFIRAQIPRNHRRNTKFVRGEGIIAASSISSQEAVFSNAPGNASGVGTGSDTLSRQIVSSQSDLNTRTGDRYGELNGLYWNESTKQIESVPVGATLTLPDGYDVFDPAYLEYVTITLSNARRGVSYTTSNRFLITSASVTYDTTQGTKQITLTMSHETHAPAGVTYTPPRPADSGLPAFEPLRTDFSFDVPALEPFDFYNINNTTAEMAVILQSKFAVTGEFDVLSPTYSEATLSSIGITGSTTSTATSVQSLSRVILATNTNGAGLWNIPDIHDTATTASSLVTFPARTAGAGFTIQRAVHHNIASPDYWQVVSAYSNATGSNGVYETHSTDNGATWSSEALIDSGVNRTPAAAVGGTAMVAVAEVSPVEPLTAYTYIVTGAVGTYKTVAIQRTTDGGANWSTYQANAAFGTVGHIHVDPEGVVWWGGWANTGGTDVLLRNSNDPTGNLAPVDPDTSNRVSVINFKNISSAITASGTKIVAIGAYRSDGSGAGGYISADSGNTWTRCLDPLQRCRATFVSGDGGTVYFLTQDGVFVGSTGALLAGQLAQNRKGNISFIVNAALGIAGGDNT